MSKGKRLPSLNTFPVPFSKKSTNNESEFGVRPPLYPKCHCGRIPCIRCKLQWTWSMTGLCLCMLPACAVAVSATTREFRAENTLNARTTRYCQSLNVTRSFRTISATSLCVKWIFSRAPSLFWIFTGALAGCRWFLFCRLKVFYVICDYTKRYRYITKCWLRLVRSFGKLSR